tara:strand:+ start:201 stop:347 length:147 start_codon:yes stop_codon:yes gene_type:complete
MTGSLTGNLMDAIQGHSLGKIIKLMDLLKQQLDRIESKIDGIIDENED